MIAVQCQRCGKWPHECGCATRDIVNAESLAQYQPEIWPVAKDVIYAAIPAVEAGLDYARECLLTHDTSSGRTTLKNKTWAEHIEDDMRNMQVALSMLRALHRPNEKKLSRAAESELSTKKKQS